MPSPDPTYDADLVLVDQPLAHSGVSHVAHLTFACHDTGAQLAQALADQVAVSFAANFSPLIDSGVTLEKPTVIRGDGTTVPTVAASAVGTVAGGRAMDSPSPQVSGLFKKLTALGGRANRGRMYIPWMFSTAEVHEDGSISGGTILADAQAAADQWLLDLIADSMPMVICNRTVTTNPTPPPATYISAYLSGADVTQFNFESVVATQRRRLQRT